MVDSSGDQHLYIVISSVEQNPQEVLFVNISSHSMHKDQSCIIDPGEHPFVTKKSCIMYEYARAMPLAALQQMEADGVIRLHQNASAPLLMKILDGAIKTKQLRLKYRQLLEQQGLITRRI
jgi:hypothetical protein